MQGYGHIAIWHTLNAFASRDSQLKKLREIAKESAATDQSVKQTLKLVRPVGRGSHPIKLSGKSDWMFQMKVPDAREPSH